jgi:hypothetical protein
MQPDKFCPILSLKTDFVPTPNRILACLGENCGWYDNTVEECAILSIALFISELKAPKEKTFIEVYSFEDE